MEIKRDKYLNSIIQRKKNKLIKVVTGLRRSGKSYLLNNLFKSYLLQNNVSKSQIICFSFDNLEDVAKLDKYLPEQPTLFYDSRKRYLVNPNKFLLYIKDLTKEEINYYLLLDEIQFFDKFVFV